jgi:DNA-binding NtrC family response regulator
VTTSKPIIFVIEDDPAFNKLLVSYLSSRINCEIRSFITGEECIDVINEGIKPDIVLQDYELPFQNGIEIMQQIKKKSPDSEFIFLSGQTNVKVAVNALQDGAFDYIVKDNHAKENALNKIDQVLRMQKLQIDNSRYKFSTKSLIIVLIITWIFLFLYYFILVK